MEQQKKKRGENWSSEEKEILRHIIAQSAHIIEDKSTKTSINILKTKEWKNVMTKLNEITGKYRSEGEIKLAWKRMKLAAKCNLSAHRREQQKTGGGEKPPSPSPEDLEIVAIAPHDFVIEVNDYDSDAVIPKIKTVETPIIEIIPDIMPGPSFENTVSTPIIYQINEENPEYNVVEVQEISINECVKTSHKDTARMAKSKACNTSTAKNIKKSLQNRSEDMRQSIIQSNTDFKKRQLEMMEVEHQYNIKIANLKIKKLELQIALLESKKNTSTQI